MKIAKIELGEIRIPLVTPFKTALRTVDSVNDIVVRITADDGREGFGEAPATAVITGDTKGSIVTAVRDFIAPAITGMDIEDMDGIMGRLHKCIVKNTSAKAAVDMAVYDLYAKNLNRPLYKILGGGQDAIETDITISVNDTEEMVRDSLWGKAQGKPLYQLLGGAKPAFETDITISVNPTQEMVRDSLEAVARGFHILKVKVGKDGTGDVERIAAIRQAVGKDIVIRVDANQGWKPKEAVRIIRSLEDKGLDIDLVEQPVDAHDFAGMQFVTANVSTPILADESVFSPRDAIRIIQERAADLINIKLMKTGGIYEALKICGIAESFGVECMTGCMLESKLAVSAAAHLAAARGVITRHDLDGPALCRTDPYEGGPVFAGAQITMTEEPGIGITKVPAVFA